MKLYIGNRYEVKVEDYNDFSKKEIHSQAIDAIKTLNHILENKKKEK